MPRYKKLLRVIFLLIRPKALDGQRIRTLLGLNTGTLLTGTRRTPALLKEYPPAVVCSSLQRFILEARRTDGTKYPAKTLYAIPCGLLRHSREVQADPLNFLDRKGSRLKKHHGTCDVVFRKLQQDGIGATKKSVQVRILRHRLAYKGLCFSMWEKSAACVEAKNKET